MQPIVKLSHLISMRKLFFILILFCFSNTFAQVDSVKQKKINHVFNLSRLLVLEPSYGLRYNIGSKIVLQPEIVYRSKLIGSPHAVGAYSIIFEGIDEYQNQFRFNTLMFSISGGFKISDVSRVDITPFYRYRYNNNLSYYDGGCDKSSSCPETYLEGGGMYIKKYGVRFLLFNKLSDRIEGYYGWSLFERQTRITYNKSTGDYSNSVYNKLQERIYKEVWPSYQMGVNYLF